MKFQLEKTCPWSAARAATLTTAHGIVQTPIFMPVATQAVLRGVDTQVVDKLDYQVLLANTFHLLLRPGPDLFKQFCGIHNFMRWPKSVLTDSGGFQIFSLSKSLVMSEQGARFRSYVNGDEVMLTPERSIAMQQAIGSDIMMVLDQCINSTSDRAATIAALELTTRWAKRSFAARGADVQQALFGIVQGACFADLRRESAKQITAIPFDGFALGGLAVGETKQQREQMVEFSAALLPADKPRYLMGVGTPIDLLEAVKSGMDMFDCILPTSLAHQGVCFTSHGKLDLRRTIYRTSEDKLDARCSCSTCSRFSRAYLHHLKRTDEHVGHQLLSVHNLTFYRELMRDMRRNILAGSFKEFYESTKPVLLQSDTVNPGKPCVPKPAPALTLGDYEVVISSDKSRTDALGNAIRYGSVRQVSSGETMHSVSEPMSEAHSLYVAQSGLVERVASASQSQRDNSSGALIVWDVGLGAATNAMVAILELEKLKHFGCPVEIVSFENDLNPLRLALRSPSLFPHLRHRAPHDLLNSGVWQSAKNPLSWRLLQGDFSSALNSAVQSIGAESAAKPHIIWYDPFSYKVNCALWSRDALKALYDFCEGSETALYTYTASTAVRAAMLAAGWYVGAGIGTGPKSETTVAFTQKFVQQSQKNRNLAALPLLNSDWLERWRKSGAQQPFGTHGEAALIAVAAHPQFELVRPNIFGLLN